MLFVLLLFSSIVFNNAVPLSQVNYAPHTGKNASNVNSTHYSLLQQVLSNRDGADSEKSLMSIFNKLDPSEIDNVIGLVQALLLSSTEDLDRLNTAVADSTGAFDAADSAHNAAILAQVNGVAASEANLQAAQAVLQAAQVAHDQVIIALQADVDSTLVSKNKATTGKTVADDALASEKIRLTTEIANLNQVISILSNLKTVDKNPLSELFVVDDFTGSYNEGVTHCRGLAGGYDIASVHSDAENAQIWSQLDTFAFLGATDRSLSNYTLWHWEDGSVWDYIYTTSIDSSATSIAYGRQDYNKWVDYGNLAKINSGYNLKVVCRKS